MHFLLPVLVLTVWAMAGLGFSGPARSADQASSIPGNPHGSRLLQTSSDTENRIDIPGIQSFEPREHGFFTAQASPDTKPESTGSGLPPSGIYFGQDLRNFDGTRLFDAGIGPEWVEGTIGVRLFGSGTLYSPQRRYGIRLDGAYVQSEERRELAKVLVSLGAAYKQDSELIGTAAWLNRYHFENYDLVGEQGDHFDQFSLGMHWRHAINPMVDGMKPGVRLSFEGLYYNVSSETVYSRRETLLEPGYENTYLWEYALGGGQQYEGLLGMEFGWPIATLHLQGGYRGKEYEEYLGYAEQSESDPKAKIRLTFHDIVGFRLLGFFDWDPDLTIAGAETSKTLIGPLSFLARAEYVKRDQMLDETRYFLGFKLMFPYKKSPGEISSAGKMSAEPGKNPILGHWLQPVEGTAYDHLMVLRKLTRRTLVDQIDLTPNPFKYVDRVGCPCDKPHTSNTVSITGISGPVSISIAGNNASCEYDINGNGSWSSDPGTVKNNDIVEVRQTSSASYSTTTDCTLTAGTESDTYSITTELKSTPAADTTNIPDPFDFVDRVDRPLSTLHTSNTVDITGIDTPVDISIDNLNTGLDCEYRIGSGSWTSTDGTVSNNDTVEVRQTSSASYSTTTDCTLTAGTQSDTYSVTTLDESEPSPSPTPDPDITPDPFEFVDRSNLPGSTSFTSNTVDITGIDTPVDISIDNLNTGFDCEYRIGSGSWTSGNGTANNNDRVEVRQTSSKCTGTRTDCKLTAGTQSDIYTISTTETPYSSEFWFGKPYTVIDAVLGSVETSGKAKIYVCTNNPVSISISGNGTDTCEYSIDGGSWASGNSSVNNDVEVQVRVTASVAYDETVSCTLTAGGHSETFSVSTEGAP